MTKRRLNLAAAIIIGTSGLLSMAAALPPINLNPKDSVIVRCAGQKLAVSRQSDTQVTLSCRPAPGWTPTASPTPRPQPTSTPVPSATRTATPPPSSGLDPVDPAILGTCSAAAHDRYVVTGPDGQSYRTWHAQQDPSGCAFAHEHGHDPRTSLANPALPPFGYIGRVASHPPEPHEGFKVFVANAGMVNDEGRRAIHSTRLVAHMGTGGAGRFTNSHHSLIYDMVAGDGSGRFIHLQGMADTGKVGSICDNPRQGRTVMTLGCEVQSAYEIWEFTLSVAGKVTAVASTAVFDPITARDPANPSRLLLTADAFPQFGSDHFGCDAEAYHGPIYWYNAAGQTVLHTDAFGNLGGSLRQEVSAHATDFSRQPAYNATDDGLTQFKRRVSQCAPGLGLKN